MGHVKFIKNLRRNLNLPFFVCINLFFINIIFAQFQNGKNVSNNPKYNVSSERYFTDNSGTILMNVNNGEILSLVSLPDYDLNKRLSITDPSYTNKITKGVYELGSVFKTFTLAAALENKVIQTDTIFKNLENKVSCAGREI